MNPSLKQIFDIYVESLWNSPSCIHVAGIFRGETLVNRFESKLALNPRGVPAQLASFCLLGDALSYDLPASDDPPRLWIVEA